MEIIIFVAVVVILALLWNGYVKTKKTESDQIIDNWQPPKAEESSDVAPRKSADDRVEAPAPTVADVTAKNKQKAVAKAKPVAAKKTAAKPTAAKSPAKKTPVKKKST